MYKKTTALLALLMLSGFTPQAVIADSPPKSEIRRMTSPDKPKLLSKFPSNPIIIGMPTFRPDKNIDYKIQEMNVDKNIDFKILDIDRNRKTADAKPVLKNHVKPVPTQPLPLKKPRLGPFKSPRHLSPLLPLPNLK